MWYNLIRKGPKLAINTILDLDHDGARKYFLQSRSYCNFCLPLYFDFQPLLNKLASSIEIPKNLTKIRYTGKFCKIEQKEVNKILYTNKDGKLAWRPLQLMNPAAYVYLVNVITKKESWGQIKNRFKVFQGNKNIKCCSLPVINGDLPDKGETIKGWSDNFEKESIKLSLDYGCMLITDIANCYSSIYTHSIAWALHKDGMRGAKKDRDNHASLCNIVDGIIEDISYQQTNGIPQGSILMDFIAEIVLGYADSLLSEAIQNDKTIKKNSYYILRYRDDYRIFTKDKTDAEKIARHLSSVLTTLNLKLNENKTKITEDIITDAQKSDKLYWRDVFECKNLDIRILQIHSLSEKYPNSGSIDKALIRFYDDMEKENMLTNDLIHIASVVADIAFRNPRTYSYTMSILGRIETLLNKKEAKELFNKIIKKLSAIPNSEYLNIWLQRLSKKKSLKKLGSGVLCNYVRKVIKDPKKSHLDEIWDYSVCGNEVKSIFNSTHIVDVGKFETMKDYPTDEEIKIFQRYR